MPALSTSRLEVLVSVPQTQDAETKHWFKRDGTDVVQKPISTDKLKASLRGVASTLSELLADLKQVGLFQLTEVELGVEITSEGGICLVGTASVGASAAITLKFERGEPVSAALETKAPTT